MVGRGSIVLIELMDLQIFFFFIRPPPAPSSRASQMMTTTMAAQLLCLVALAAQASARPGTSMSRSLSAVPTQTPPYPSCGPAEVDFTWHCDVSGSPAARRLARGQGGDAARKFTDFLLLILSRRIPPCTSA